MPSAIFYDYEAHKARFGRDGIAHYIEGTEGRLLRSLKSVLGSSLIDEATLIQRKRVALRDIIGMFLRHLKALVEQERRSTRSDSVVLGRPVRFVDHDDEADRRAESELVGIAKAQGFRDVETQFEPVAAALAYEQDLAAGGTVADRRPRRRHVGLCRRATVTGAVAPRRPIARTSWRAPACISAAPTSTGCSASRR